MQFIRLPKPIDITERVLPELVLDWMNTNSVQNIDIMFVQRIRVNILISLVIEWSKCWMPHQSTFENFKHQAWAIWDLSNNDLIWIIPDPGSQKRITLSVESISTIAFQWGVSYVEIPEWGQHSSNLGMPCLISIFGSFRGTGVLDLSWRRGKRTSTYGAAAKLVMRILTCLFIYLTRTQEVEWMPLRRTTLIPRDDRTQSLPHTPPGRYHDRETKP